MTGFHTQPGSSSRIFAPAMLAIVLLSGCAGVPPRLEAPSQATTSTLTRYNAHSCTPSVASALDAYRVPPEVVRRDRSSRPRPPVEQTFLAFIARSCEGPTCPEDRDACRIIGPSSDHHDLRLRSVADVDGY